MVLLVLHFGPKISTISEGICSLSGLLHDSVSIDMPLTKKDNRKHAQTPDYGSKETVVANGDKEEMQKEAMLLNQLTLTSWPLDEAIFENLSPRLRKGKYLNDLPNFKVTAQSYPGLACRKEWRNCAGCRSPEGSMPELSAVQGAVLVVFCFK